MSMKKFYFFVLFLSVVVNMPAQKKYAVLITGEDKNPYWTEIVRERPDGYIEDENGNVEISSAEGLAWLISVVNGLNGCQADDFEGRKVEIKCDIDLSQGEWVPIGDCRTLPDNAFKGAFYGGGHSIDNLYLRDIASDFLGLFGSLSNAEVRGVSLNGGKVSGKMYCGGIAGLCTDDSEIDNCVVNLYVIGESCTGGIVGCNRNSVIRNCCYVFSKFEPVDVLSGGVVGVNESDGQDAVIENCYFDSRMIGSLNTCYLGGIAGLNKVGGEGATALIRNCYTVLHGHTWCGEGGIVGRNTGGDVLNCYYNYDYDGYDINAIGDGDMGDLNCSVFSCPEGQISILSETVSVGGIETDDLLEALNYWIARQENPSQYRRWKYGVNGLPEYDDPDYDIPETDGSSSASILYPNPTIGIVHIEGEAIAEIKVYNTLGQLVKTVKNTNEVDLKGLPKGIYTLRIACENGPDLSKKVVLE